MIAFAILYDFVGGLTAVLYLAPVAVRLIAVFSDLSPFAKGGQP
jgi:hypothetical protein